MEQIPPALKNGGHKDTIEQDEHSPESDLPVDGQEGATVRKGVLPGSRGEGKNLFTRKAMPRNKIVGTSNHAS